MAQTLRGRLPSDYRRTTSATPTAIQITGDEALLLHSADAQMMNAYQALSFLADHARTRGDTQRAAYFTDIALPHRSAASRVR